MVSDEVTSQVRASTQMYADEIRRPSLLVMSLHRNNNLGHMIILKQLVMAKPRSHLVVE